mgnify:CR=1 FL=1
MYAPSAVGLSQLGKIKQFADFTHQAEVMHGFGRHGPRGISKSVTMDILKLLRSIDWLIRIGHDWKKTKIYEKNRLWFLTQKKQPVHYSSEFLEIKLVQRHLLLLLELKTMHLVKYNIIPVDQFLEQHLLLLRVAHQEALRAADHLNNEFRNWAPSHVAIVNLDNIKIWRIPGSKQCSGQTAGKFGLKPWYHR